MFFYRLTADRQEYCFTKELFYFLFLFFSSFFKVFLKTETNFFQIRIENSWGRPYT